MLHKQRTLFSFLSIVKGVATNSEGVWRRASGVRGGGDCCVTRVAPLFPIVGAGDCGTKGLRLIVHREDGDEEPSIRMLRERTEDRVRLWACFGLQQKEYRQIWE